MGNKDPKPQAAEPVALVPPRAYKFNLSPSQSRCCKCDGFVLAISGGADAEAQAFLAGWAYWCPRCESVVLPTSEAERLMVRGLASGQVGIIASWPLPLNLERRWPHG